MFAGQVIFGGSLSLTVTVKLQESLLPEASVAVHFTVLVPFGNANPDAGEHDVVTPGQLSVAVSVNVVTAVH